MSLKLFSAAATLFISGLLPFAAKADLTFIGRSDTKGQGFGSVINVLTLQRDTSETGSVSWNGSKNVITGAPTSGCDSLSICDGNDTGASGNIGKTSTQTFGTVGWNNAASIVVSLNLNQTGANQTITVENLFFNVYSPTGVTLFTAHLPDPMAITTIEQGTGSGYFIYELTSLEQAEAESALFGANYNANNRVGISALLDATSNDGAETFGVVNGNVVPEPGYYGALALGLAALAVAVTRSKRNQLT